MKTFFQTPPKIFLWVVGPRWRYLEGVFDLADYFSKKIGLIRHFNQNILKKTCWGGGKNHAFFAPHDQDIPKFARLDNICYMAHQTHWDLIRYKNHPICAMVVLPSARISGAYSKVQLSLSTYYRRRIWNFYNYSIAPPITPLWYAVWTSYSADTTICLIIQ